MRPIHRLRQGAAVAGAIAACLLAIGFAAPALAADLRIEDAWVRSPPPGMQVHAAYLTIRNDGDEERHLVAAESPRYAKAEIHFSKVENGIATMSRQEQVTIPAKGALTMAPGGFHVMLMHPKAAIAMGETVPITLSFADGTKLMVMATVQRGPVRMEGGGHGHGGMKMN